MGKKQPSAPDPIQTASAQTASNIGTAIANQRLNNVNQVTPDGTLTYEETGTTQYTDPTSGAVYDIPTTTATQTLSDSNQRIYDQTQAAEGNLAELANNQSGTLKDHLDSRVDLSRENIGNYINDHFTDDFNRQQDYQKEALDNRLSAQGIKLGSAAYDRAQEQYSTRRNDAYDNLIGNQYDRAQQSILAERNQPINETTALLSGSQVSQPNFVNSAQSNIANTDVAGIINADYQNRLSAQNSSNGVLGGLFQLGGTLGSAAIGLSDERAKENIKKVGKTKDGQNIYSYNYIGDDTPQMGLIAQEVEKKKPDAVMEVNGLKMVNYDRALQEA